MGQHQPFAVEIAGSAISASLHWPSEQDRIAPVGAVLLVHGAPKPSDKTSALFQRITDALTEAGVVVATYAARSFNADDRSARQRLAVEMIDDASAVFRWLALRDELDLDRLGVLGFSLGTIVASGLAQRTDRIARLCLLAPVTAEAVLVGAERSSAQEIMKSLGAEEPMDGFLDELETLDPVAGAVMRDRPTLIVHGAADRAALPELSFAFSGAIELASHDVQHTLVARADHFFTDKSLGEAGITQITRFFAVMNTSSDRSKGS